DRAAEQIPLLYRLLGVERARLHFFAVAEDVELGNLLALLHRRTQGAAVGHRRRRAIRRALRHEQVDLVLADQADARLRTAEDVGISHDFALGVDRDRLEPTHPPGNQLAGFLGPLLHRVQTLDHRDQPMAIIWGRDDFAIAGLFSVAGLQPIDANADLE